MSADPFYIEFAQELHKKAGLDKMPEQFKKEAEEGLAIEAQRRVGIMSLDEMDEQAIEDFEKLATRDPSPQPQEMVAFFNKNIPDYEEKVMKALKKFADEFIEGAEKLKKLSKD